MTFDKLKTMKIDDLWALHEAVGELLASKCDEKKQELEQRLLSLKPQSIGTSATKRRPYPKVVAKYRNPEDPRVVWSGRGKKPVWLVNYLKTGHKIDDCLIRATA